MFKTLVPGSFAILIETDRVVVVDRTMHWDASGYGAHAESAVDAPSTTWYFAEGSTSGDFALFYLLQNPASTSTQATVRFLRPAPQPPIDRTYTLAPRARLTIPVDAVAPELASTDVSGVITATQPIIVERAMYLSRPGQPFAAGHESAGVTAPATEWFLAEGATGTFFDLFVLIENPGPADAQVEVQYLLPSGGNLVMTKQYVVARREPVHDLRRRRGSAGRARGSGRWRPRPSPCGCVPSTACRSSSSGRCGGRSRPGTRRTTRRPRR